MENNRFKHLHSMFVYYKKGRDSIISVIDPPLAVLQVNGHPPEGFQLPAWVTPPATQTAGMVMPPRALMSPTEHPTSFPRTTLVCEESVPKEKKGKVLSSQLHTLGNQAEL